jgi:hypothetical protein
MARRILTSCKAVVIFCKKLSAAGTSDEGGLSKLPGVRGCCPVFK